MPSIIATVKVREDKIEEAKNFLANLARETLEKEKGTLAYVAHQRKDEPTVFVLYEKYADDAAFATHGENLKAHGAAFAGILAGAPDIVFLEEI